MTKNMKDASDRKVLSTGVNKWCSTVIVPTDASSMVKTIDVI